MKSNQKGMSAILLVVVVLILGVGSVLILKAKKEVSTIPSFIDTISETGTLYDNEDEIMKKEEAFKELKETSSTPEEIDNKTLEELDALMNSVDTTEDDFSDLAL